MPQFNYLIQFCKERKKEKPNKKGTINQFRTVSKTKDKVQSLSARGQMMQQNVETLLLLSRVFL